MPNQNKEMLYESGLKEYLEDGINWMAHKNSVILCPHDDVVQFAADSFHAGFQYALSIHSFEQFNPEVEE